MVVTFDLTLRQAARVLEQALRTSAQLTLEPRTWPDDKPLTGTLTGHDANLLTVELHDQEHERPLTALIGVFCDGQTVLSGQLYLFSTCVIDVADTSVPPRLVLASPTELQLVNRRKFERHLLAEPSMIHMNTAGTGQPPIGDLVDISAEGLACRVSRANLDDVLFVGDEIRVAFELPGNGGYFDLPAVICNKTKDDGNDHMTVGLQFKSSDDDPAARDAIQRLRSVVCHEVTGTSDPEGFQ